MSIKVDVLNVEVVTAPEYTTLKISELYKWANCLLQLLFVNKYFI